MTSNKQTRTNLLYRLIKVEGDITELEKRLAGFEWDFDGEPVILEKSAIKNVLLCFIQGTMTTETVRDWAEALELREDIDYPEQDKEMLSKVMHILANPDLEGKLTLQSAQKLLSQF